MTNITDLFKIERARKYKQSSCGKSTVMPRVGKFAELSRSFQNEGMLNFKKFSPLKKQVVCCVILENHFQLLSKILKEIIKPRKLNAKLDDTKLLIRMGFETHFYGFKLMVAELLVSEIFKVVQKQNVSQLYASFEDYIKETLSSKGVSECETKLVKIMFPLNAQLGKLKYFFRNTEIKLFNNQGEKADVECQTMENDFTNDEILLKYTAHLLLKLLTSKKFKLLISKKFKLLIEN